MRPVSITPGSLRVEFVLWICFLIPGFIYALWRIISRYKDVLCVEPRIRSPHQEGQGREFEIDRGRQLENTPLSECICRARRDLDHPIERDRISFDFVCQPGRSFAVWKVDCSTYPNRRD